jgi:hypothetical protein
MRPSAEWFQPAFPGAPMACQRQLPGVSRQFSAKTGDASKSNSNAMRQCNVLFPPQMAGSCAQRIDSPPRRMLNELYIYVYYLFVRDMVMRRLCVQRLHHAMPRRSVCKASGIWYIKCHEAASTSPIAKYACFFVASLAPPHPVPSAAGSSMCD